MIDSPCQQLCSLDPQTRQCVGCGRAASEIAAWQRLDDDERRQVLDALPERLEAMRRTRIARNAARRGGTSRRSRGDSASTPGKSGGASC